MSPEQAIDITARSAIWWMFEAWSEQGWENLPDFTEADYERIVDRIEKILPSDVTFDRIDEAHKVLVGKVTDE